MQTSDSQVDNHLKRQERIELKAFIEGREVELRFEGNVLFVNNAVAIDKRTFEANEALENSIDVLSRVSLRDRIEESIFLLLLIQLLGNLNEDGETLRQTTYGRMDPEVLSILRATEKTAREYLASQHVTLGEMRHYDADTGCDSIFHHDAVA
jgi:hypothetical protein